MSDKPKVKSPDPTPVQYSGSPEERWAAQQEASAGELYIYLTDRMSQRWRAWFAEQPEQTKAEILKFWEGTSAHPDIVTSHPREGHARAMLLIQFCAAEFGYEAYGQ